MSNPKISVNRIIVFDILYVSSLILFFRYPISFLNNPIRAPIIIIIIIIKSNISSMLSRFIKKKKNDDDEETWGIFSLAQKRAKKKRETEQEIVIGRGEFQIVWIENWEK